MVASKRKEVISVMEGTKAFVLVVIEVNHHRNNTTKFPNTDGGDISKEFEGQRKPHIQKALKAKLEILLKKGKPTKSKGKLSNLTAKHKGVWQKQG